MSRKPFYTSAEEMQIKIDMYFHDCEGRIVLNSKGEPMLNKYGEVVYEGRRPPTMSGLANALGFMDRQSLLEYRGKKEFRETLFKAKSRIEQFCEEQLFTRDGCRGAMFSLANNFKGWRQEKEEVQEAGVRIICDIPRPVAIAKTQAVAAIEAPQSVDTPEVVS